MKDRLYFFFSILLLSCSATKAVTVDSLLRVLDQTLHEAAVYTKEKEIRIEELKAEKKRFTPFSEECHQLNRLLYAEYKAFVCDSTIAILNETILSAQQNGNQAYENQAKLDLVYQFASAGMYKEASDLLSTVKRERLQSELLIHYYACFERIYGELSFYTQDKVKSGNYWAISQCYKDSILAIANQFSEEGLNWIEAKLRDNRNYSEALQVNDKRMTLTSMGGLNYALIAYCRSLIYRDLDDVEAEKYYLALSAISDIKSATKDHASLWMLAKILYDQGELERAYTYIRFSWSETNYYNARLRSWQSADVLSLIDQTYQAMIEKQNKQLSQYGMLTTLLLFLLLVALIYIYRQMKRLSIAHTKLEGSNKQLSLLNNELKAMNESLQSMNLELSESNQIKEEYIARFVKLCSTYLDKLDAYRRMVHKAILAGKTKELLKTIRSQESLDREQEKLLANFDEAFLQIFPHFVEAFNKLLGKEEQIALKRGELLNTELRIFALIRLGIEDSSQIAEFLRYSVNTIYNYRAKVKNKAAVSRDDFENYVKRIR